MQGEAVYNNTCGGIRPAYSGCFSASECFFFFFFPFVWMEAIGLLGGQEKGIIFNFRFPCKVRKYFLYRLLLAGLIYNIIIADDVLLSF